MSKKSLQGRILFVGLILFIQFSAQAREVIKRVDLGQSAYKKVTSTSFDLIRPSFSNLKGYEKLYGSPKIATGIQQMQYPWSFMNKSLLLGWGAGISLYSTTGKTGKSEASGDLQVLEDPTSLVYFPINIGLGAQLSLFSDHSFILRFLGSYEESFYEEVRRPTTTDDTSEVSQFYINRGWGSYYVFRLALDISLNRLDRKSILTLKKSFGINNVYLSPFFAMSVPSGLGMGLFVREASKLDFGGSLVGVSIRFETR